MKGFKDLLFYALLFFACWHLFQYLLPPIEVPPPANQPAEPAPAPSQPQPVTDGPVKVSPPPEEIQPVVQSPAQPVPVDSSPAPEMIPHPQDQGVATPAEPATQARQLVELHRDGFMQVWVDSYGGVVRKISLDVNDDYYVRHDNFLILDEQGQNDAASGAFALDIKDQQGPLWARPFKVVENSQHKVVLESSAFGGRWQRVIKLDPEQPYLLHCDDSFTNYPTSVTMLGPSGIMAEEMVWPTLQGLILGRRSNGDHQIIEESASSLEDEHLVYQTLPIAWAGCRSGFFCTFLSPHDGERSWAKQAALEHVKNLPPGYDSPIDNVRVRLSGEGQALITTRLYAGPRQEKGLGHFAGMDRVLLEGVFVTPLAAMLRILEGMTGNWGVAIIIMTLLVRLAIHPLSRYGQKSMHKNAAVMKTMKPKLDALKKKYANDRMRMQQEMLQLQREHGMGPGAMLGCLPLFMQIPVFYALFTVLREMIELRGASFLWVTDLSQGDILIADLGIPYLNHIRLLPFTMVAVTAWQMIRGYKQSLESGNMAPEQLAMQKTMSWMMPAMFFFMGYHWESGLLLYWTVSGLFGVVESNWIKKHLIDQNQSQAPAKT